MTSIYKHFAKYPRLPIYLKDVKDFVLEHGKADKIVRYPVDMDGNVLRGMLRVYNYKPAYASEERVIAEIAYQKDLDEATARVVCCKEMLHLLDNHAHTADTKDKVSKLIEDVTLPFEAVASLQGKNDHSKLIEALCILVPTAAGNLARAAHHEDYITADDLATLARIPEMYARVVLSDDFHALQNEIMSCK